MTTVAAIRASSVDVPLYLHVAGAMALVGLLVTASLALARAWRATDGDVSVPLVRFGLWTLVAAFPAWILMRIGAQWTYSREGWEDAPSEPAWLAVGYITADLGGALLLISLVLAAVGLRRLRRPDPGPGVVRVATVIALLLVAAYVVAIFAMTTKPD